MGGEAAEVRKYRLSAEGPGAWRYGHGAKLQGIGHVPEIERRPSEIASLERGLIPINRKQLLQLRIWNFVWRDSFPLPPFPTGRSEGKGDDNICDGRSKSMLTQCMRYVHWCWIRERAAIRYRSRVDNILV